MSCGIVDIEDSIGGSGSDSLINRDYNSNSTGIVRRVNKRPKNITADQHYCEPACGDSFIPGSCSVYIKTWGCSHNSSDSEYIAGQLAASGYRVIDESANADVWILNSCTVKTPAEDHLRNSINEAQSRGKYVIVAGCVSQSSPTMPWLKGLSLLGVQQIDRVVEVLEETLKGNSVRMLGSKKNGKRRLGGAELSLPKIRKNPLVEILAINTGCLNRCTYCKTKQARGDLASYYVEELVERAAQSFSEGVKELWLTSEDLGAYGRDIGVTLPDLLQELVKAIPEDCRMRLGMTNPPYIMDYVEEIADVLNHPRVYAFIHMPVQSGSDAVLSAMKREYTRADFEKVVDCLIKRVPGVTIATDIICGFPTEDSEDFDETLSLVNRYRFPALFINQFYPRPGTPAAKMKRIDTMEVKRRTKALSDLFHSYSPYENRVGQVYENVLITEESFSGDHYVGHNKSYEQILLPKVPAIMGKMVKTRIVSVSKYSMVGELLDSKYSERDVSCNGSVKDAVAPVVTSEYLSTIFKLTKHRTEVGLALVVLLFAVISAFVKWF